MKNALFYAEIEIKRMNQLKIKALKRTPNTNASIFRTLSIHSIKIANSFYNSETSRYSKIR